MHRRTQHKSFVAAVCGSPFNSINVQCKFSKWKQWSGPCLLICLLLLFTFSFFHLWPIPPPLNDRYFSDLRHCSNAVLSTGAHSSFSSSWIEVSFLFACSFNLSNWLEGRDLLRENTQTTWPSNSDGQLNFVCNSVLTLCACGALLRPCSDSKVLFVPYANWVI